MKNIIIFTMILITILFAGCRIVRVDYKNVEGTVISKNYIPQSEDEDFGMNSNGSYIPLDSSEDAKYNVVVSYENVQYQFDDKSMYDGVKIGDKKQMRLETTYNESDNTVNEYKLVP